MPVLETRAHLRTRTNRNIQKFLEIFTIKIYCQLEIK